MSVHNTFASFDDRGMNILFNPLTVVEQ